jgi:3-oxoacyl-[acyl-carrier-protein] synthase-3
MPSSNGHGSLRRARIASLATFVPPKVLTNADLERMVETSDEWILQRTGIRTRHIVEPGVATSDLATEAARAAVEKAGLTPDQIDFIIVGTTTPDMMFPSTACLIQHNIGATNAWGYDLLAACSGFTYALTTAANMVATGGSRHALVIGADVMSSIIDYTDRTTCVPARPSSTRRPRRTSASSTSRTTWTAQAGKRSRCPAAAAGTRPRTTRSTGGCTT